MVFRQILRNLARPRLRWSLFLAVFTAAELSPGRLALGGPAQGEARALPAPTEATSLETATLAITGLGVFGSRLLLLPARSPGLILSLGFHAGKKTRLETFGQVSSQERLQVVKDAPAWDLIGADITGGRIALFEGLSSSVIESDPVSGKELLRRSVPWDLIKPPADRGGEATQPETAALRQAFKRAWLSTTGLRIVGLARMPASWQRGKATQYLLASRIKGFPLLQMECSPEEPSSCMIVRKCYLEGAADLPTEDITGLGIAAARRLVVIGDRQGRRLASFRFDSCFHVPRFGTYKLPDQLKRLTNVTVDADGRLWLTTATPDDYLNASVFFWSKDDW